MNDEGVLVGVSCNECFEENPTDEDHNAQHVKMQADGNRVLSFMRDQCLFPQ